MMMLKLHLHMLMH